MRYTCCAVLRRPRCHHQGGEAKECALEEVSSFRSDVLDCRPYPEGALIPHPVFITGEAGSGKTWKLMQKAGELGDELVVAAHQRALAISLMHGARRRLQATLSAHCPRLPVTVSTIHSFALGLVNRWRRSLNIGFPVTVCVWRPAGLWKGTCARRRPSTRLCSLPVGSWRVTQ